MFGRRTPPYDGPVDGGRSGDRDAGGAGPSVRGSRRSRWSSRKRTATHPRTPPRSRPAATCRVTRPGRPVPCRWARRPPSRASPPSRFPPSPPRPSRPRRAGSRPRSSPPRRSDPVGTVARAAARPASSTVSRCGARWSPRPRRPLQSAAAGGAGEGGGPGWMWSVVALAAALVGALVGGAIVAATTHDGSGATVKEISAGPALLNGTTNIETVIGQGAPGHRVHRRQVDRRTGAQSLFGGSVQRSAGGPGHRDDHHLRRGGGDQQPRDRRGHHHHGDPVRQPQGAAGHAGRHRSRPTTWRSSRSTGSPTCPR